MDCLKQLFRDTEIEMMLEENPDIQYQDKNSIRRIIKLLADQKCNHKVLRNILQTNPSLLTRDPDELEELIYKLKEYGVLLLNKAFDLDPFLTNKNAYEIDSFVFMKQKEGLTEDEIIRIIQEEPYLLEMTSI